MKIDGDLGRSERKHRVGVPFISGSTKYEGLGRERSMLHRKWCDALSSFMFLTDWSHSCVPVTFLASGIHTAMNKIPRLCGAW